jgi:hypothetical protein
MSAAALMELRLQAEPFCEVGHVGAVSIRASGPCF